MDIKPLILLLQPPARSIGMDHSGKSNSLLDFRSVLASEPNQELSCTPSSQHTASCQQYGTFVRGDTSLPPNSNIQGSGIGFIHSVDLDKWDRYYTVYLLELADPLCSAFWPAAPFNG